MDSLLKKIEGLFREKCSLYQALLETLKQEKESLSTTQVDVFWGLSEEKRRLATDIEAVRADILAVLTGACIRHGMDKSSFRISRILPLVSGDVHEMVRGFSRKLEPVKDEISRLLRQNKLFTQEYLSVLEEVISTIVNSGNSTPTYGGYPCPANQKSTHLLFDREA